METLAAPRWKINARRRCPKCAMVLRGTAQDFDDHERKTHGAGANSSSQILWISPSEAFFRGRHYKP